MAEDSYSLTPRGGTALMFAAKKHYENIRRAGGKESNDADFLGDGRVPVHGYRFRDVTLLFGISSSLTQPGIDAIFYGPTKERINEEAMQMLRESGFSGWDEIGGEGN